MKKMLAVLLILLMAVSGVSFAEENERFTCGNYSYIVLEDGTAEITSFWSEDPTIEIPETLDGRKVTSLGDYAFSWCELQTSFTIPDGVKNIGDHAFEYCTTLECIRIPDSVRRMGRNPFCDNRKLKTIIVSPDHPYLAVIDGTLFSKPDKQLIFYPKAVGALTYEIPRGIREIGEEAFYECGKLTAVTIPDSVTSIGPEAFRGCESLDSLIIPDSVTSIGEGAFDYCPALTTITVPDSVVSIGKYAFNDCPLLTVTVSRNSYAKQYCEENGIRYTYADANDWLNN